MKHTINNSDRYPLNVAQNRSKHMIACVLLTIVTFFSTTIYAQDTVRNLDEVMIQDVHVSNKAPLTTSNVGKDDLQEARSSVSVPYMIENLPSVVASSENGTVGATSLRIRGVDASRINVNINGITLNDPESQSVFWANIPNLGGMMQSLQVQRGVGASTGGSAAFGAAINMQTMNARNSAYGEADLGIGSWNTRQYSIAAGTGILKSGLSFDIAYSGLTSDGFLRGGQTDQQSLFATASWYGERTLIKLLTIIGQQNTGITWDGASIEDLEADPHYNSAGEMKIDGNIFYYGDATDNYYQQHYQLYISHLLSDIWTINAAFDYTHGYGYDNYYKKNKTYSDYVIMAPVSGDLITRKSMDNDAYTGNLSLRYNGNKLNLSFGDNILYYHGNHYGEVRWLRDTSIHASLPSRWYENDGHKLDNSTYVKATYDFSSNLNAYADLQLRAIHYTLDGFADDLFNMDFSQNYLFFNPKFGINYRLNDISRTYLVAGISNREPTRADIKDAIGNGDTVKAETLLDIELGYQLSKQRYSLSANIYTMLYKDQLTPSGDLSSSGYSLMENVEKSYRIGVELQAGMKVTEWMNLDANLTLSQNKVIDYTYTDFTDGDATLQSFTKTTDLALSPNVIGAAIVTFIPVKDAKVQLIGKYVGKQYADNTSREVYAVDPYFLLNLRASYTWHLYNDNEIEAQLLVNNLLDHNYRLNAWVGDGYWKGYYHGSGWLQQPGINAMGRVIYRF